MPSQRRVRILFYLVLGGVVTMLFFTSHFRERQNPDTRTIQDFYHKTVNAMERGGNSKGGSVGGGSARQKVVGTGPIDEGDVEAQAMAERLKLAEQKAKDSARAKGPNKPDAPEDVIGVGSSASGQIKKGKGKTEKPKETEEDLEVEAELNAILKKSPIIIFSKSYCPYSKRAKGIMLEKYLIEPPPHVVELDQHPLGKKIQERLGEMTGRTTVPNIMIYGISIGGGDDIASLDKERKLAEKIKDIGGRRIEVTERFVEDVKAG